MLNINLIDVMPPGLYEVVLTEADGTVSHPDLVEGKYIAKLAPRTLDDIRALGHNDAADQRRFETVARVGHQSGPLSHLRQTDRQVCDDASVGGVPARDAPQSRRVPRIFRSKPPHGPGRFGSREN